MSGFAAVVQPPGLAATHADLDELIAPMAHLARGGVERWAGGPVALAHLAGYHPPLRDASPQPVAGAEGRLRVVVAGRIDGVGDLRAELGHRARIDRDASSADLALAAYLRWGRACVDHLLGDWVILVWDARSHELWVARDRFGLRACYVATTTHGATLLAGDLPPLIRPDVDVEPDEVAVACRLVHTWMPQGATFYRGVSMLPGGHELLVEPGTRPRARRWWNPDLRTERRLRPVEEYVEELQVVLGQALADQLRDQPVASIALSGGLDSTLLAANACRLRDESSGPPVEACSMVFPGVPEADESTLIAETVAHLAMPWRATEPLPCTAERLIETVRRSASPDSPFIPTSWFLEGPDPQRRCLLFGQAGDEWFTAAPGAVTAEVVRHPFRAPGILRDARAAELVGGWREAAGLGVGATLNRLSPALASRRERLRGRFAYLEHLDPDLVRRTGLVDRLTAVPPSPLGATWRAIHVDHSGADDPQQAWADRGTTACFPLLDLRVAQMIFALPDPMRWRGADDRWFQRRALEGLVPPRLLTLRPKADVQVLIDRHLDLAVDLVGPAHAFLHERGWLRSPRVQDVPDHVRTFSLSLGVWAMQDASTYSTTLVHLNGSQDGGRSGGY